MELYRYPNTLTKRERRERKKKARERRRAFRRKVRNGGFILQAYAYNLN